MTAVTCDLLIWTTLIGLAGMADELGLELGVDVQVLSAETRDTFVVQPIALRFNSSRGEANYQAMRRKAVGAGIKAMAKGCR
jgi:hypothetical protein